MTVKSVKIVDGTTNSSWYGFGDKTGSYQSIKAEEWVTFLEGCKESC